MNNTAKRLVGLLLVLVGGCSAHLVYQESGRTVDVELKPQQHQAEDTSTAAAK